jgi:phosphoribosylformylglycinamidine synthase
LIVKVIVTPRQGILDPQGRATEGALRSLGFRDVKAVHVGRYVRLEIDAGTKAEAAERARQMCEQLLANPLVEDYRFEVEDG